MTQQSDRPAHIPWPPIIFVAALIIALALGYWIRTPWLPPPFSDVVFAVGWLIAAASIVVAALSIRTLVRHKTTVLPTRASEHLVTDGPFAISRNPIYLAYVMLLAGVGLIGSNIWFLLVALAAAFAIRKLAIEPEEAHLALRFGKRYRDYSKRVRRWI
jgi:protein-S-isoprenylcysteine O-methyltransferase Ste14